MNPTELPLAPWGTFFAMTASSAAALTGLMFVVLTLVTGERGTRPTREGLSTYSTPTTAHFGAALFVSALLCAPWGRLEVPAAILAVAGTCGAIYIVRIAVRTRRLEAYTADSEDWTWFAILPLLAYGSMLGGAVALLYRPAPALFVLAGAALLLLFIGIRNAWDIVTYLALAQQDDAGEAAVHASAREATPTATSAEPPRRAD
jgi:hypothetical protein